MAEGKYYLENATAFNKNAGSLRLGTALDSFRAYSWEIEIPTFPGSMSVLPGVSNERLTIACKQITQVGFTVEDIEINRVNDKYFYPGKATPEEITVTFDNLIKGDVADSLFAWMRSVYDPVTGSHYGGVGATADQLIPALGKIREALGFKSVVTIWQLDAHRNPMTHINLYGCYPKGWKLGEFNYATNDFHTIEMTLKYDFAVQISNDIPFNDLDPRTSVI
jgi:hypothetical protein